MKFLEQKVLRCFPHKATFYPLLQKRIKHLEQVAPKQSSLAQTVKHFVSRALPHKSAPQKAATKKKTTSRRKKAGAQK